MKRKYNRVKIEIGCLDGIRQEFSDFFSSPIIEHLPLILAGTAISTGIELQNSANPFGLSNGAGKAVSGKWVQVSESMSDASRAYQRQITGMDQVWLQNGVKFDGIKDGVLIEAKGSYSNFVNKNTGNFQDWFTGQESLISQANRQLRASEGMPINWYFADEASMKAAQRLFQERRISGINFILKPLE